ncbi:MAG: MFS transporter [Lewinellaceae bacterium]|nr:MFS transporter [Saprospiraceae bacterium]MCB9331648.1 MFS transporter [Lewinellaceae bacterium]
MKINGLRWWIVGLVGFATVINYIDRNALGIMWPEIWKDIGLGEGEAKNAYAAISTFFLIAYAISKGLSGRLFDLIGTRIGFVVSIVVWSVSAALHGFAKNVVSFSIFRAMLGLGEAGNWPGATKANAEWFPIKERALAQGIFNSGASIGAIVSAPLIAVVFTWLGWKMTFIVLGSLGLLWLIPWLLLNRGTPETHPFLSEEERKYILEGAVIENAATPEAEDRRLGYGELVRYKQSWAVMLSRFLIDPIWWMFVIWLPIYLNEAFGFNVKEIGFFAWVPYVGAALGSIFGGWLARRMIQNGDSVDKTRKRIFIFSGFVMLPGLVAGAFANDPVMAVVLIAVVLFGFQMAIGNLQTLASDYFSGKSVGTLAGMGEFAAALGSILLSTFLIPWLSEISYLPVFILGAVLVPLGLGAVFVLGGKIERVKLN